MSDARKIAAEIFFEAVGAVEGEHLIRSRSTFDGTFWIYTHDGTSIRWDLPKNGRVIVVGGGKATAPIAVGLEAVLGDRIDDGCIVVKYGHAKPLHRIRVYEAGHPVPDAAGLEASKHVLLCVENLSAHDRVFVIVTGGASALLEVPAAALTVDDISATTQALLLSRADIDEMNTVRASLSRIKGGGLLDAIGPAQSMTLLISDIPDNNPAIIGSGPTFPAPKDPKASLAILERYQLLERVPASVIAYLKNTTASPATPKYEKKLGKAQRIILADSSVAVRAAVAAAQVRGCTTEIIDPHMHGDTHEAARKFSAALLERAEHRHRDGPPNVLLSAGETTLDVRGHGVGGRNQEFALVAAEAIAGHAGVCVLAAGSDGTDGPTDAAGAFADGDTQRRGGGRPALDAALANNDSNTFFAKQDALFITGPTGTNVMDLVIGIAV